MNINFLFLNLLIILTLLGGIFSITSKNPVISILYLITTFVLSACYIILLGIDFVGLSYIIVYVGAIAVLFLFVIMMINVRLSDILETGNQYTKTLPFAILLSIIFLGTIFSYSMFPYSTVTNHLPLDYYETDKFFSHLYIYGFLDLFINGLHTILNIQNYIFSFVTPMSDTLIISLLQIEALGFSLYTFGASPLIICSLILLLAMFAAIILSKNRNN